jgi:hypothetical protein
MIALNATGLEPRSNGGRAPPKRRSDMNTATATRHAQIHFPRWRAFAKFCAAALLLVLPGACIVIATLWLYRRRAQPGARA